MNMQEKNLEKIMQAVGNIEISTDEKRYLEWLSKYDPDTVNNIVSVMTKMKSRGAGRKKSVDVEAIHAYRAQGKTQEWTAREMNISISTVRRNWH
ncbi:MAG: hypothetical protein RBR14_08745 [Candidatus Cloacimonas acidaminovorans]|nr:hypothetical protein [Candidatus Cloacimonas acidaminovorans]